MNGYQKCLSKVALLLYARNTSKSTLIQNSPLGRRIGKDVFLEKSAPYFGNIRTKYAKVSSGNFVCTDLQYPFNSMVALPSLLEWNLAKYAINLCQETQ